MNAYDWLVNLPIADMDDACRVIEVSFSQGSRKDFYRNGTLQQFEKGDWITVEGVAGFDVGEVQMTGEIVRLQLKKKGADEFSPDMRKVLRRTGERDLELLRINKGREKEALIRSRAIAKQLNLNMKVSQVEFQADGKKATFFYIADDRVDFRELIKIYASEFKVKVEMRQIGARQEAGKIGGIGSCGRELCCATWLTDFKSVNTAAARYQNLSINQTKLSGQCGRLKCCLNYELDTYLDALQGFPENADMLRITRGTATLIKKDIFRNLMWYVLPDSNKQYPLTIERVKAIKALNGQNVIPDELEAVDVTTMKQKEVEPEFVDVVGHITLKSLEKSDRKKHFAKGGQQQRGPREGGQRESGQREGGQREGGNQQQQPRTGGRQGEGRGGNNSGGNGSQQNRPPRAQNGPQQRGPQRPRPEAKGDGTGAPPPNRQLNRPNPNRSNPPRGNRPPGDGEAKKS
jgi:cell fate regulator YaaT (PSP1 superfamily)